MSKKKRSIAEKTQNAIRDEFSEEEKRDLDVSVSIKPKKKIPLPPNIMVFQTFAYLASTKLKPGSNKILMYLFSRSVYENFVGIDVQTFAEKLDMCRRTVIRSLNELEENGIIIKSSNLRDRRRNDYFINPMGAWKGNSQARKMAIDIIEDQDPDQLDLFGERLINGRSREKSEIKARKSLIQEIIEDNSEL